MSNEEKKINAAQRLFDAIGEIDDSIVKEAENVYYRPKRSLPNIRFTRLAATAAVVLALCTGIIGGFIIGGNRPDIKEDMSNSSDGDIATDLAKNNLLKDVLFNAVENHAAEVISLDAIDFFDGEISIIWKYEGQSEYYRLEFNQNTKDSVIKNKLSASTKQIDEQTADSLGLSVWISYGDGEVVSPYLKSSNGNVGYAELFDYSPEVVPNDDFAELVKSVISN